MSRSFWSLLVVAVLAANAIWCWRNRLSADVAWFLYNSARLQDGAVLYRDIPDINLPAVYLMYLPIAWFSSFSRLPIQVVLYGGFWALVAGVLILIPKAPGMSSVSRGIMSFSVVYAALALHRVDLGQRDPICALLFLPLVVSAYLRIEAPDFSPVRSGLMVLLAALGIAIKPYFLIPWMLVMLVLACHLGVRRAIRLPEAWLTLLVSMLSWIVTLLAFPSYLPMVSGALKYYSALNGSLWSFLPLLIPSSIAIACLLIPTKSRLRVLIHLSALATAGFVMECLLQRKGFTYHVAPAMFWAFLTAAVFLAGALQRSFGRPVFWRMSSWAVMASVGFAVYSLWSAAAAPPTLARNQVDELVSERARGKTVLALSTDLWTSFPLILEAGARDAFRGGSLWTIPAMYQDQVAQASGSPVPVAARYHARAEMTALERRMFDEVIAALSEGRPAVILVQTGRRKQGLGSLQFDFIDYFSTDERFKLALHAYKPAASDEKRLLLVREDSDTPASMLRPRF